MFIAGFVVRLNRFNWEGADGSDQNLAVLNFGARFWGCADATSPYRRGRSDDLLPAPGITGLLDQNHYILRQPVYGWDWTDIGLPAMIEGAVRLGFKAAKAVE